MKGFGIDFEWTVFADPNGKIARLSALSLARSSASGFHLLNRSPILIVEDELFIALELQTLVEDAGGQVVGPVGSANAAQTLLQTSVVGAAILDVQLTDGDVTPVADALAARGVPMVFQSAVGLPSHLQLRYPNAIVYRKPVSAERLLKTLAEMTGR
jgi:DNA-binding NtrC family response regulator